MHGSARAFASLGEPHQQVAAAEAAWPPSAGIPLPVAWDDKRSSGNYGMFDSRIYVIVYQAMNVDSPYICNCISNDEFQEPTTAFQSMRHLSPGANKLIYNV